MINLYNSKENDFNHNGICVLQPLSCIIKEELNGIFELELTHSLDSEGRWRELLEDNIIKAPTPKGPQLFRIYSKTKNINSIKVYARHISYDLLDNMLLDVRPTNLTGQNAIKYIFNNTLNPHNFTVDSDITITNTAYYIRKNPIEALIGDDENSFINRWGGELYRDNFKIYMNNSVGKDRAVKISYGKNLLGIEETLNTDSLVTRAIPIGYNGITIPEVYIDSLLINSYGTIKTKEIKLDKIKVNEDNQTDGYNTLEEAQQAMRDAINDLYSKGIDKPVFNYKVNFIELSKTEEYKDYAILEEVLIGDIVTINHSKLGIDLKARAISYVYNSLFERYEKVELGSFKNDYIKSSNSLLSKVEKAFNESGKIDAGFLQGAIDFMNVEMKAMADSAEKHKAKAIIFEDRIPGSQTYGAMAIGTKGFMIASQLTPDGRDWNWRTFGTGKGFVADLIIAGRLLGNNAEFNLNEGYIEVTHSNGDKTRMDTDGLVHVNGSTKTPYHYLQDIMVVNVPPINEGWSGYSYAWIQLPQEYKGKNFKVFASIAKITSNNVPSTLGILSDAGIDIVDYDYKNAKVKIGAYLTIYDTSEKIYYSKNEDLDINLHVIA